MPFDVPPGVRALHVEYDYSDRIPSDPLLSGGNTLDIGMFDPRGIGPSSPGFRGWSGSHKSEFTIAETWATPPYRSGPILPGTWHVLLGPYKVGPRGCDYSVSIFFSADPGVAVARPSRVVVEPLSLSPAAETGWLRGDLHCHTLHSDGDSWPADMLAEAVRRGLDFLGVTDHNQVGHHADYAQVQGEHLPILLPGIEVTTYGGHWNAWGTDTWWEFREPTEAATTRAMQTAAASGALVSVNHPKPYGPAWEYPGASGFHAVEVWNGDWPSLNAVSLAWWEQLLRSGRRVVALGGSDTHNLKDGDPYRPHAAHLGLPTTWAHVGDDRSTAGVLAALREGRAFISRDVEGPQLYLSPSPEEGVANRGLPHGFQSSAGSERSERWADCFTGGEGAEFHIRVRIIDARGAALMLVSATGVVASASVGSSDWSDVFHLRDVQTYVRAQLMDEHGTMLALSNPLFTE